MTGNLFAAGSMVFTLKLLRPFYNDTDQFSCQSAQHTASIKNCIYKKSPAGRGFFSWTWS